MPAIPGQTDPERGAESAGESAGGSHEDCSH